MATPDPFETLGTYFRDHAYPFTKHHIDSYRELLRRHIPETIASFNPITMVKFEEDDPSAVKLKVEVFVGDTSVASGMEGAEPKIYIDRPTFVNANNETVLLTPYEARLKNYSYMAHLFADVSVRYTEANKAPVVKVFKKTWLGEIPIMLHSDLCVLHGQSPEVLRQLGECIYDQGGYFIIDGKEKVIISQERITTNRLFMEKTPKDPNFSHRAHIHCTGERGETMLSPRTLTFYAIRRELPTGRDVPDIKEDYRPFRGAILVSMPSIPGLWPLFLVFRLLGVESDREIIETIFGSMEGMHEAYLDAIYPSIRHAGAEGIYDTQRAIEHVAPATYFKSPDQVHAILVNDLMPNMNLAGADADDATPVSLYENKAKLLGQLTKEFLQAVMGIRPESDRDGYVFKRVDISGFLLAQLFQSAYIQMKNTCRDMLDSHYHYIIKNRGQLDKLITPDNIRKFLQPSVLTEIMNRSLKGRWGPKPEDPDQEVIQDLGRISYIQYLSHLRRVNLPLDRSIKLTSPHRLHSQQWGIMCPFESPDGASIGYLKNFALLSHITFGTDSATVVPCLIDLGMIPLERVLARETHDADLASVYLNGQWVGVHASPASFVEFLRLYRRNAMINCFTSISWDISRNTVRILTEAGRACRPLWVVEHQALVFASSASGASSASAWYDWVFGKRWKTLHPDIEKPADLYYKSFYIPYAVAFGAGGAAGKAGDTSKPATVLKKHQACMDLLDIEEANTSLVAMTPADIQPLTTHCEIHPSTIFSVVTNNIPFANHNQAPRNIFHGAQSKQAIGIYATNFTRRFDTMAYIQHYPQRPLITTQNAQYTMSDRMPNGFNVIVAVMSYSGYNQEDGIMINKAAIDRGLFHITAYKSVSVSEEALNDNEERIFMNPDALMERLKENEERPVIRNYHPDRTQYGLLDENGIIREESYIPKGESAAIVGVVKRTKKYVREKQGLEMVSVMHEAYEDLSIRSDVHHYGRVDKVYMEKKTSKTPYRVCKVRFRKVRKPSFGDKHSSRHGQKGVVGLILREEDLPFTKEGIRPDIIINPHAFPSRMTIGHMVECIFAKLACLDGTLGDGSVFVPFKQEVLCDQLEDHGFQRYGSEILYNGFTGHQIPTEIFIGPTFYLRLKHMVADKVHARGVGFMNPHDQLTRQPTAGRSHMGGLRIGEMERDSLLSHGVAQFIKETMMERSDRYKWHVCKRCGVLIDQPQLGCRVCQTSETSCIETPYAMKLFIQEMAAMGLSVRLSDETFDLDTMGDDAAMADDDSQAGGTEPPSFAPGIPPEHGGGASGDDADIEEVFHEGGEGDASEGDASEGDASEGDASEDIADGIETPLHEEAGDASEDEAEGNASDAEAKAIPEIDGDDASEAEGNAGEDKDVDVNIDDDISVGGDAEADTIPKIDEDDANSPKEGAEEGAAAPQRTDYSGNRPSVVPGGSAAKEETAPVKVIHLK